jgi:hypothetical protein
MIVELILLVILIVIYYTMVVKQEHFVSDNLLGNSCRQLKNFQNCCYSPEIFNENCDNCTPKQKYDQCLNYGASLNFCNQNI